MKLGDVIFAFVAFVAVGCFIAVVALQYTEQMYYEESNAVGKTVWPVVSGKQIR